MGTCTQPEATSPLTVAGVHKGMERKTFLNAFFTAGSALPFTLTPLTFPFVLTRNSTMTSPSAIGSQAVSRAMKFSRTNRFISSSPPGNTGDFTSYFDKSGSSALPIRLRGVFSAKLNTVDVGPISYPMDLLYDMGTYPITFLTGSASPSSTLSDLELVSNWVLSHETSVWATAGDIPASDNPAATPRMATFCESFRR